MHTEHEAHRIASSPSVPAPLAKRTKAWGQEKPATTKRGTTQGLEERGRGLCELFEEVLRTNARGVRMKPPVVPKDVAPLRHEQRATALPAQGICVRGERGERLLEIGMCERVRPLVSDDTHPTT